MTTWAHVDSASCVSQAGLAGSLGGIFYFHSLSQIGLLLVDNGKVGPRALLPLLLRPAGLPGVAGTRDGGECGACAVPIQAAGA